MRKTAAVPIESEGRDRGKVFIIREAPAAVAERWATRALLALARSGVQLPENAEGAGWAGLAYLGFQALSKIDFHDVQPLLDEMWQCITIRPDPKHPEIARPLFWGDPVSGEGSDIEEIATMIRLRAEVFNLHSGFSLPGVSSTSSKLTTSTPGASQNIPTSRQRTGTRLGRHSPPGKRRS